MKLRTEVRGKKGAKYVIGTPKNNTHDLLVAHALMQAIGEVENNPPGCDPYEVPEIIQERASELMREWGFDSVEVAGHG